MPLDPHSFVVHDVTGFPVIFWSGKTEQSGYAPQWIVEMDALMEHGLPFVLIVSDHPEDEAHEDRKLRGHWLKKNKLTLALLCRSIIGIEPDAIKRAAMKVQSAMATKAFGIQADVVATIGEAHALAQRLLARR